MSSPTQTSSLEIRLVDDVSPAARVMAEALKRAEAQAKETAEVLAKSGASDKLQASLKKFGASKDQILGVAAAWKDYAKGQELAADRTTWTRDQINAVRDWEGITTGSLRAVMQAERTLASSHERVLDGLRATERKLRDELLAKDQQSADRRLAQAVANAKLLAEARAGGPGGHQIDAGALRVDQQLRARIEAEITADFRHQKNLRVAASEQEAEALDRIATLHKEQRIRAVQEETAAIIAERARQQAKAHEAREAMMHRAGVGHYVATGVAAAVSAHGVVSGIEGAVEQGAELQRAAIEMHNAGMKLEEVARLQSQSLDLSTKYANVSQTAVMELTKEVRSVLTKPEELAKVMPSMVAAKSVLDAQDPTGEMGNGLGVLVKAGESLGATQNPERFITLLNGWVRAMQVMGKTINPEQIYEFVKYSKTAGAGFSDRFLMTTGPSLVQELGGSTSGNDLAMLSKQLTGGLANRHTAAKALAKIGMIKEEDLDYLKTGEVKGLKDTATHALTGEEQFTHDPDKWVYDVLLPHMEAAGMKSRDDQLAFVQKAFTGTAADVISKLITQRESFEAHAKMYGEAAGINGALANNLADATVQLGAFKTALGNLEGQITLSAMPTIGASLNKFATWTDDLAQIAAKHPAASLTAGAVAAAGALYGAARLGAYAMNGFGLGASATALDTSAGLLTEAAIKLGAEGEVPGGFKKGSDADPTKEPGSPSKPSSAGLAGRVVPFALGLGGIALSAPGVGPEGDATRKQNAEALDDFGNALDRYSGQEWLRNHLARSIPETDTGGHGEDGNALHRGDEAAPSRAPEAPAPAPTIDAPQKSLWHRIFGATKPGYMPASYVTDAHVPDHTAVRAGSPEARALIEQGVYDGVVRAFETLRNGGDAGQDGGGLINASYEGDGGFGGGVGGTGGGSGSGGASGGGGRGGDLDVGSGPGTAAKGAFGANQQAAYKSARAAGLSDAAARALVANMSGESLRNPGDNHWDSKHMSQGIVQWDPTRAAAIRDHFGKLPKDMSVAEQTQAAIWEIQNNPRFARTARALKGGDQSEMMRALVENYEVPRDTATALRQRFGFLRGFKPGGDGASEDARTSLGDGGSAGRAVENAAVLNGMTAGQAARAFGSRMTAGEWCADFVNGALHSANMKGVNSSIANSFLGWGHEVAKDAARKGDVLVENRGRGVGTPGGHAGLFSGRTRVHNGQLQMEMVSGNYGNHVNAHDWTDASRLHVRRSDQLPPDPLAALKQAPSDDPLGLRRARKERAQPAPEPVTQAMNDVKGAVGLDLSELHEAHHHVDSLQQKLAGLSGSVRIGVHHHDAGASMGGRGVARITPRRGFMADDTALT